MKKIRIHILFWVSYFLYAYLTDTILNPHTNFWGELILFLTHNIFLFYSSVYFLNILSFKSVSRILYSLFIFISFIGIFWCLRYLNAVFFGSVLGIAKDRKPSFREDLVGGVIWVGYIFFLAAAYYYYTMSLKKERLLRTMQRENMTKDLENMQLLENQLVKEKEKLKFEYAYLRAQINPHFLYNTLDFLYAKSLPCSKELSEGIMRLSEILRYSVKAEDEDGAVLLSDEIEHVRNVIEINRLRFNNIIYIDFTVEGQIDNLKIIPLTLITLVENVLKHGEINNPVNPATIRLTVDENNRLCFFCRNKKRTGPKEMSTGIGMDNTRRRLEHVYGDQYRMETTDAEGYYQTQLRIML